MSDSVIRQNTPPMVNVCIGGDMDSHAGAGNHANYYKEPVPGFSVSCDIFFAISISFLSSELIILFRENG